MSEHRISKGIKQYFKNLHLKSGKSGEWALRQIWMLGVCPLRVGFSSFQSLSKGLPKTANSKAASMYPQSLSLIEGTKQDLKAKLSFDLKKSHDYRLFYYSSKEKIF